MKEWSIPAKHDKIVTMKDAIGDLPEVDPFVKDIPKDEFESLFPLFNERAKKAREISRWHVPPTHIYRQVIAMRYTPTGKTAFDNDTYKPRKEDGTLVRGYRNTYMRQKWDTPAYTITMDNRKISSQGNVHPGRYIGNDANGVAMYSDPRVLTLYEIMRIMSLPEDWALPHDVDEAFIRRIIGEGIPPYFVKQLFENIPNE